MASTTDRRLAGALLAAVLVAPGCRERAGAAGESARASNAVADAGAEMGAAPGAGVELARYRLGDPPKRRAVLPEELREISGLASTPDGRLVAHGDEEGTVFQIDSRSGQVLKRFHLAPTGRDPALGKKAREGRVAGDFEGIAVAGDRYFLVTSTGVLVEFAEGPDGASVPYEAHTTGLGERCEVEGLVHDPEAGELLLLCKQLHAKAERDRIEIHAWSLADRRLASVPRLVVPRVSIRPFIGDGRFNGSALTFTPGGRSLVLVAGPQRQYLEVALDGRVVNGGPLDRTALPQPEGVTFTTDGTLLISSEGGRGEATLNAYSAQ
jgi:hypothetical protein